MKNFALAVILSVVFCGVCALADWSRSREAVGCNSRNTLCGCEVCECGLNCRCDVASRDVGKIEPNGLELLHVAQGK